MNKASFAQIFGFNRAGIELNLANIIEVKYTDKHNILVVYDLKPVSPMIMTFSRTKPDRYLIIETFLFCKRHHIPMSGFEHNKHIKSIVLRPLLEPKILKDRYKNKNHPLSELPTDIVRALYEEYL